MNLNKLRKLVHLNWPRREHAVMLISALVSVSVIVFAFWLAYPTSIQKTLAITNMWPPHSHEGWPIQKTSSYNGTYTLHLQRELNFLDGLLQGFNINQLTEDGVFGPGTENAVRSYQSLRTLTVDGIVGNQTWTYLEYDIFQTHQTYAHPLTVAFRYPVYSQCRKITNNAAVGLSILVPVRTSAEWDAFRAHLPTGVSDALGNCDVSGGGGGGGGVPAEGGGGWTADLCSRFWSACCPAECTSAGWACTGSLC